MTVKSREIQSLHFEELGQGAPVVFLCGLGGDHRSFRIPAQQLSKQYRVLLLDPRDAGESPRATESYTTADMARDVAETIESTHAAPAHVIGHSLGGLVAQELALSYPRSVRSLVLASCHAGAGRWRSALVESWILLRHRSTLAEFTRATLPWLVARSYYASASQVEGLVRYAERNAHPQEPEAFERQARAGLGHDTHSRLSRIDCSTLVLTGEVDLVNPPEDSESLARGIPRSAFEILPDVGHLPHVERPAEFRKRIERFLSGFDQSEPRD